VKAINMDGKANKKDTLTGFFAFAGSKNDCNDV
jgi:hypothetical protein